MGLKNEGNNPKGSPPAPAAKYPNPPKVTSGATNGPAAPPPPRHAHFYPYPPGAVPPHPPPPPTSFDPTSTESGHRPGPYTTAQYEKARAGMALAYGAPPPHGVAASNSGSPPMQRGRDPPPPPHSHYSMPQHPPHPPSLEHNRANHNHPSGTAAYQFREEHRPPHWPRGFPFPGQPYPPPPPGDVHHHPAGPYRYSDSSLRREAVSRLSNMDPYSNEVDGREGATSPSQIESSHREEVTTMGCTCKKTKCLKLYCQCFAVKIYCGGNCRCMICKNTQKFEKERKEAIRNILARNPTAFDTKFKKSTDGRVIVDKAAAVLDRALSHKLGCKCRKSACMKKYCECYAGSVKCSANCRCVGCKNMPRGGVGPGTAPLGAPMLTTAATNMMVGAMGQNSLEEEGSPKRSEPWMMNAAQNLVRIDT